MSSNTNSFIAQYCAAKGETWDTISLAAGLDGPVDSMGSAGRLGQAAFFFVVQI